MTATERTAAWSRQSRGLHSELLERIYDLDDAGYTINRISGLVGLNWDVVRDVLGDRDLYDPYVDEVAMDRALDYDVEVIRHLTPVEWQAFVMAMGGRRPWSEEGMAMEAHRHRKWGDLPQDCREAVHRQLNPSWSNATLAA